MTRRVSVGDGILVVVRVEDRHGDGGRARCINDREMPSAAGSRPARRKGGGRLAGRSCGCLLVASRVEGGEDGRSNQWWRQLAALGLAVARW